jgi:hypothetical protein
MDDQDALRIRLEGRLETLELGLDVLTALATALREGTALAARVDELEHLRERLDEAVDSSRTRDLATDVRQRVEAQDAEVSALASARAQVLGVSASPAERLRALAEHFPLHYQGTFRAPTDRFTFGSVLKAALTTLLTRELTDFQPHAMRQAPLILSSKVLVVDQARFELGELAGFRLPRRWGLFEPLEVSFKNGGRRTMPVGGHDLGIALERVGVPYLKA